MQDGSLGRRVSFSIRREASNKGKRATVKGFVNKTGFGQFFELINRISKLIETTLRTALYPIHLIGFHVGSTEMSVEQLKIYYMIYKFTSKDDLMGNLDKKSIREALIQITKELGLEERQDIMLRAVDTMESSNYELQFIGLNFERDKNPNLKLYFKPSS